MDIWRTPEDRRRFMKNQGIVYLERADLAGYPSFSKDLKTSPYYLENCEEFDHLTALYGPSILNTSLADVSIRLVGPEVGYGLFAESDLAAGAFVGEYTGVIQTGREAYPDESDGKGYETDYTWDYPDAWYEDVLFEINALKKGNELRYVNHSFEPNLVVEHTLLENRWVIFFITGQAVKAGTQFTVDYGEEYWSGGFRELVLF